MFLSDWQKIGLGLSVVGLGFCSLGVLMLFDRALLAMGNLLFLLGTTLLLGRDRSISFFLQPAKWRGSITFFAGLALLLYGWTITGLAIESFGALNLFGDFFPKVQTVLCALPFVGSYFDMLFNSAAAVVIGQRIRWLTGRVAMPVKGP